MPKYKLKIDVKAPIRDLSRYFGVSIDVPLDSNFWETQPDTVIGMYIQEGHYEGEYELSSGKHTVYVGTDASTAIPWSITAYMSPFFYWVDTIDVTRPLSFTATVPEEGVEVPPPPPPPGVPPVVPPTASIPSLPPWLSWLEPVLNYWNSLIESVVNYFAPIFEPLKKIPEGLSNIGSMLVEGLINSISTAFQKSSQESINTTLKTVKEVTGSTPEWKTELDNTLSPLAQGEIDKTLKALSPETLGKSPLTPEEASKAAAGIGSTVTGLSVALWLAHAAAEAASLGQYEAIKGLDDMVIAKLGLGALGAKAVSIPLDQLVFKRAEQFYAAQFTPEIPSTADLINMVVKEKITLDEFKVQMKYQGINAEWSQRIWDAHFIPPNYSQILQALYRGTVKAEDLPKLRVLVDLDPAYNNVWDALTEVIPDVSELTNELVKEVIDLDTYAKYMRWHGYGSEWAKRIWDAHFVPPSLGDILTAWRRGKITEEDVDKLMILVDLDPRFKEIFDTRKYVDPSISLARFGFEVGALNADQVHEIVMRNGYLPDDAKWITDFIVRFQERRYRSRYLMALQTGIVHKAVSPDELTKEVVDAGYTKETAEWMIKTAEVRRKIEETKEVVGKPKLLSIPQLKDAYYLDKINQDQLRTELLIRGYEVSDVDILIQLIDHDKVFEIEGKQVVSLSITQMLNAFRYGEMSEDELRTKLQLRGLALDEVDILINTKKKEWGMIS